jgi:hypothetical protein
VEDRKRTKVLQYILIEGFNTEVVGIVSCQNCMYLRGINQHVPKSGTNHAF